jgi:tetratricopeptide (TPR) repeat protein
MRGAVLVLASLVLASELSAQTSRRRTPTRPASASRGTSIRAELAATLLESGKYSDAAREYSWLLQTDSRNTAYRLGLARALTWGGSYREAEGVLRVLAAQRPGDGVVEELQQLARSNLEPNSREARQWVFERPYYAPYRIALARALVRERQPRAAIAEYEALLARNPTSALLRGLGDAYTAANDRVGGIARLRNFVARAPADTGYRLALADLLVADRQFVAAIAQSDTVLSLGRTPAALVSQARINIARGDLGGAERNLIEALSIKQAPDAYLMLGDTYRWRGEFGRARTAYGYARTMRRDRTVTAAFAQLARDERAVLAFDPAPVAEQGWQTSATTNGDNAGVHYSTLEFRRGFGIGAGFVGSATMEVRQLRETSPSAQQAAGAYAAELAVAHEAIAGAFLGRVGASAGLVFHPLAQTVPSASFAATARYYAWSASVDVATGPAYPSLRTIASVIPSGNGSKPLTEVTSAASLGGPLGVADVALGLRQADISDGNRRNEFLGYARFPLAPALAAVYSGNRIRYAQRTAMYWSPETYASNSLGLELAARQVRGWSVIARALPGIASTNELPFVHSLTPDSSERRLRFLISTGAELAYRNPRWESAFTLGWGRIANYSRTEASARITLVR